MSKLELFTTRKGRPFTVSAHNGKGTTAIQFYDGYVTISDQQPGARSFHREIKITRSAWLNLLRQVPAPTRLMEGPDFDPNRAERVYARQEQDHIAELREQKRARQRRT